MADKWWKKGIIYQIYPRSFADGNADGFGDFKGIIEKLDHLSWLGVDAVWFSPFFKSPMIDFGYDVSDYTDIDPMFGDLQDFDTLVKKAKNLGLKIILDLVSNHSSNEHPWFLESRSSKINPKRDWYYWRDGKECNNPPNNWKCISTGESAWSYDEKTQQYFMHSFNPCQPDLNWRNDEVKEEMLNVMKFWLDKGVDGFRIDMISWMGKDEQLRDNIIFEEDMFTHRDINIVYNRDDPVLFNYLQSMRELTNQYSDITLIGEVDYNASFDELIKYYGKNNDLIDIPANFRLILLPWELNQIKSFINAYDDSLGNELWPNFQLGNHDRTRYPTRIGNRNIARLAAMMLLTLRGTPFIYYGEEIGMEDVFVPKELIKDPIAFNFPELGRDPVRSPMQWNSEQNSGFTNGKPWLPVSDDYKSINVEHEKQDPKSFLSLYKNLIELRKNNKSLSLGDYVCVNETLFPFSFYSVPEEIFIYIRSFEKSKHLICLNFSEKNREITLPILKNCKILISTLLKRKEVLASNTFILNGQEGCIIDISD